MSYVSATPLAAYATHERPTLSRRLATGERLPPALLTMPTFGGTLAAVRALGRYGVSVTVAGSEFLAPARWSRHARRFRHCPPVRDTGAFLDWLVRFGEREPGAFLYPASDDLAWLFASHQAQLQKHFLLFQPPVGTLVRLLDKKKLYAACDEVGLATMPTWFPQDAAAVQQVLGELPLPLVVKPRTQVLLSTGNHGHLVERREDVVPAYADWLRRDRYLPGLLKDFGDVTSPMLQAFRRNATHAVYSLSGFVHRDGQLLGARAARKLLQRPRRVGVGLCFEDAPVELGLLDRVVQLCRRTGYHGVFEVEFILDGDEYRLIDFNPRFYGQMHFENARALPLPLFAYLAALGDEAGLAALAEEARAHDSRGSVYCFRFAHHLLLTLRRLAGTSSAAETARWRRWGRDNRARMVDASADTDDWLPGIVHASAEVWNAARHARGYLRHSILEPD